MWRVAIPGALIQSTVSTVALATLLRLFGWGWIAGLILGSAISVASTVVMAHVLAEHHDLHAQIGHIAIGWTVVEDILDRRCTAAFADSVFIREHSSRAPGRHWD